MASPRSRKRRKPPPVEEEFAFSRRAWVLIVAGSIVAAAIGIVLYAVLPGVGTYQANTLLLLPLAALILYALHQRLPLRLQWILSIALAPLGTVAYLLDPNDQWWNYGPLSAVPLAALAAWRLEQRGGEAGEWLGGMPDGPWGPP